MSVNEKIISLINKEYLEKLSNEEEDEDVSFC